MPPAADQKILIKPIGNDYSRQAIDLILPIQQGEFRVAVTLEGQPDLLDIDRFYHGSGGGFWGAFADDRLVGTIGLMGMTNKDGTIRKMFVHKHYRGGPWGIAQSLLETLIAHCLSAKANIDDLYLGTIDIMQTAMRFYERNGFVRIAKKDMPASFSFMSVDNTFYHLHLNRNLIDRSGLLAIATRLQRMSEQLRRDGLQIYQAAGIPFEPKWFPVIYVLDQRSPLSIGEIAAEIGYAHPSVISLLKELQKEKLIRSARDASDSRRRLIHLTPRAQELITRMRPVWDHMTRALTALTDTPNNLLLALDEVENQYKKENFLDRTKRSIPFPS